jgi:hypothetical protein
LGFFEIKRGFLMLNSVVFWDEMLENLTHEVYTMAKKSRGGRMTAAKRRAAKGKGGKGMVKNRPAGKNIMKT